jgi:hypothetical protein
MDSQDAEGAAGAEKEPFSIYAYLPSFLSRPCFHCGTPVWRWGYRFCDPCLRTPRCSRCFKRKPTHEFNLWNDEPWTNERAFGPSVSSTAHICNRCILRTHVLTGDEKRLLQWAAEVLSDDTPYPRPVDAYSLLTASDVTHAWIIGRSGYGKTTLLKQLLRNHFESGVGCAFIDPHGDGADELLGHIPQSRLADVIYFSPASPSCPSLNLLALPYRKDKLTDDLVSLFKLFFGSSWGPRLEMLLKQGLLTLLADTEPHSLADLQRLYTHADYQKMVADRCSHPMLRHFWQNEFPALPKDAPQSLLTKLHTFLGPFSPLETILSSPKNDVDFPAIMDGRKIFLANLSKGQLGQETTALLGGMLMTAFSQAALARSDQPEHRRIPFHLVADEFQTYLVQSFATILEEARKYGLHLTLANQTLDQVGDLQSSLFGNISALVAFQVDAQDAAKLKTRMRRIRAIPPPALLKEHIRNVKSQARFALHKLISNPAEKGSNQTVDSIPYRLALRENGKTVFPLNAKGEEAGVLDLPSADIVLTQLAMLERGEVDPSIVTPKDWPTAEDFQSLPKLRAIVRVHEYANVHELTVTYPPPGDAEIRDRLLALVRDRYQPAPASAEAETRKPRETDEDEFF